MTRTFRTLQTDFNGLAVEKFVNDAGLRDASFPGVPAEFQKRTMVLHRRLENLTAIAERADTCL